ncbi:MAG TPA: hypothetical protein VLK65_32205 [Vicinamibacteria bacterium]|nr:hypothetical protein [Vicinamibacteria bacterium]
MKITGVPATIGLVGFALELSVAWAHALAHPLEVTLSDPHGLLLEPYAVRDEITSLLSDAGVRPDWTEFRGPAAGAGAEVNIVVSPSVPSGPGWTLEPTAMGVYLTDGESSVVFVFHRSILSALGLPAARERLLDPKERRDVRRALARVAVHEVIHRLVPGLRHAEGGLMQSDLDRNALTRRRIEIDEVSRNALVKAVASLAFTGRAGRK